MDTRRSLRILATVLGTAGLLISGCTSGGSTSASPTTAPASSAPAVPAALKSYHAQQLKWRNCGVEGFQCTTMIAPLDYKKPDSGDIKLAVARKKATGPGKRIGSLLVNPGGPGGSAIEYLQSYAAVGYPAQVRARYDMVAIDPRGVARSEPVVCLTGPQMDTYTQVDQTPDDAGEVTDLGGAYKQFASGCEKRSGEVLPHVSTVETARDMDMLRALLGDEKLHYVGASYGTFLGATYAGLFPARVGRLVLDGAMDPSLNAVDLNRDQTAGFETAFQAFAADCVKKAGCPLGTTSTADAATRLKRLFADLDARPIDTGDSRRLTESLGTTGVIAAMYDESAWPQLREALAAAQKGDGSGLLSLSDGYYEQPAERHVRQPHVRQRRRELPGPAARLRRRQGRHPGRSQLREGIPGLRQGLRLGRPELRPLADPAHRHPPPHRGEGRGPDRRGRHDPRSGHPVQVGRVPGRPALLRHPPHLPGRRPHGVRPRQRLHRHGDQHLPPGRHPMRPRARSAPDPPASPLTCGNGPK